MPVKLQAIRHAWESRGVPVREGVTETEIADFEARYKVCLPEQVRRYYEYMDGMEYGFTDDDLIHFWSLAEIGTVPEKLSIFRGIPDYGGIESNLPEAESYFVFGDHSIWINVYAVRLTADPFTPCPVVWIAGGDIWKGLAPSFDEFLRRYAEKPCSVLFPPC